MTSVDVYVFENDASAFYRLIEPARALQAQGADIRIYREGDTVTRDDAAVCVFNRPVHPLQAGIVEALAAAGRRVVVDLDDSYRHLSSDHAIYGRLDREPIERACRAASRVVVTTPELLRQYGGGRGVVVPNYIPERYLSTVRTLDHPGVWVGWYGSLGAHPNDLQVTRGGVGKALRDTGADLCFIGPKGETPQVKANLKHRGTAHMGGFYSLAMMPEAVATFDVGIVPLEPTLFNEAKSWLKGLEMAAVGVPFVASPTGEYRRLHTLGAGVLADQPNRWTRAVSTLALGKDARAHLAGTGRAAASTLTIERNACQWWDAWTGVSPTE